MFPKIHIYLDPHQFTFENQKNEVFTLKTVVYIAQVKGSWRLLGLDHWENPPLKYLLSICLKIMLLCQMN